MNHPLSNRKHATRAAAILSLSFALAAATAIPATAATHPITYSQSFASETTAEPEIVGIWRGATGFTGVTYTDEVRDGQTVRIWTATFRAANDASANLLGLTGAAQMSNALENHGLRRFWIGDEYRDGEEVTHDGQAFWLVQSENNQVDKDYTSDPFNGGVARWNTGGFNNPAVNSWLSGQGFRTQPYQQAPWAQLWSSVGTTVTLRADVTTYNQWVRRTFPNNPERLIDASAHRFVYLEVERLENDPRPSWQNVWSYEAEWNNNPRLTWRKYVETSKPVFYGVAYDWSAEYVQELLPAPEAVTPVTPEVDVVVPEVVTPNTPEVDVVIPEIVNPVTPEVDVVLPEVVNPVTPEVDVVLPEVVIPNTPEVDVVIPEVVNPVTPEVDVVVPEVVNPVTPEVDVVVPEVVNPVTPEVDVVVPEVVNPVTPEVDVVVPEVVTPNTPEVDVVIPEVVTPNTPEVDVVIPEAVIPNTPEIDVVIPSVVMPNTPEVDVVFPEIVNPVTPEVDVVIPQVVTPNTPEVDVVAPVIVLPITPEIDVELPTVVTPITPEAEVERPNFGDLRPITPVVNTVLPAVVTPLTPVVPPAQPVLAQTGAEQMPLFLAAALSIGGAITAMVTRRTRRMAA